MYASAPADSSGIQPTLFIPHGAGPCFFMDWNPPTAWNAMADFLRGVAATLPQPPRAILMVSGHWLEPGFSVAALSSFASVPGFSSQGDAKNWNETDVAIFYPRIGLMNISGEGYIAVKYSDRYGAVAKVRTDNKFLSFASYDGGSSWDRL